ncbi:peptidyl-prolyl cis-trans isomerase [Spongiibacter sp. KMU-158]|uniref:peptidylprolyl isomerase n=1 Tax=Spongiibacter pelagi TaxID=2760804 RepID=A0A927C5I0_9GAMM|nr:peptidylprolyl isomerase [Spongiibacter pelagi]MBD2859780.1 peptidyl-prolyl cis-trans isomerase [Spongiibacter pelagi]
MTTQSLYFWRKPILHFLLIGSALFALDQWLQWRDSYTLPAPSEEVITARLQEWINSTRSSPSPEEVLVIRQSLIDDNLLLQEALRHKLHQHDPIVLQRLVKDAEFLGIDGSEEDKISAALELGLHKDDELIRRRLIQKMEEFGRNSAPITPATEQDLNALYNTRPEQWQQDARIQLSHIFFSADKEASKLRAQKAQQKLATEKQSPSIEQAIAMGDSFLLGHQLPMQSLSKLRQQFGAQFSESLLAALSTPSSKNTGEWIGPLSSVYGQHIVLIQDYQPARQRSLEEVRPQLEEAYLRQRSNQNLRDFIQSLRNKYRIIEA